MWHRNHNFFFSASDPGSLLLQNSLTTSEAKPTRSPWRREQYYLGAGLESLFIMEDLFPVHIQLP